MTKRNSFSYGLLPLYLYLIRAYSHFFTTGRALDFPLLVQIQTKSSCNGRCSICPYSLVSKKLDQGEMEPNLFTRIANESTTGRYLSTVLFDLQNEPLLDERIFNWVRYFKILNPNIYCVIVSNGESIDKFSAADIMQSNLDRLVISLNAYSKEMYETINTGLNYDSVMKNVSSLVSNYSLRNRLVLSFVHTKHNESELRQATRYWKKQGIQASVVELTDRAGSVKNYQNIKPRRNFYNKPLISMLWTGLMVKIRDALGCHFPFYQMNILYNGDVLICCHDWNRVTIVGNVRTNSLREVWNSEKMNEIRRSLLRRRYKQTDACWKCSSYSRRS